MALALDSLNPLIYCQYAEMLINDDKLRQAESFLDQSLKIGDNFSLSYFQMGEVYFKKMLTSRNVNHFDSAYSYYSAAIEIDPNNPRYHVSLPKLLFNAYNTPVLRKKINGRFDRKDIRSTISKNCNLAIKLNPNYFEAYFWKAMNKYLQENTTLYFFDNTKSEALDVLKRLITKYPEIPEPYFYVAQLYQAFNDDGHSIKYYNLAIEQDSMHAPSYKALYHIYKKNNRSIDLKKLLIEINDRFTESEAIIKGNAWVLQVEK
jgi:tetratricopeptide (TPR) repeat protein